MKNLLKFKDVKMNGKFVYNNCLFIKTGEGMASVQGSNKDRTFESGQDVGIVAGAAYAPGHEPQEAVEEEAEESEENE